MSIMTCSTNNVGGSVTSPGGCGSRPLRSAQPCQSSRSFIGMMENPDTCDVRTGIRPPGAGLVGMSVPSLACFIALVKAARCGAARRETSSIGTTVASPSCDAKTEPLGSLTGGVRICRVERLKPPHLPPASRCVHQRFPLSKARMASDGSHGDRSAHSLAQTASGRFQAALAAEQCQAACSIHAPRNWSPHAVQLRSRLRRSPVRRRACSASHRSRVPGPHTVSV